MQEDDVCVCVTIIGICAVILEWAGLGTVVICVCFYVFDPVPTYLPDLLPFLSVTEHRFVSLLSLLSYLCCLSFLSLGARAREGGCLVSELAPLFSRAPSERTNGCGAAASSQTVARALARSLEDVLS